MYNDRKNIENASEAKPPSDTKVLLAPLGRYALIGLAIVATIVTTAIMLDDQLNDIDAEVASLKAELQKADRQNQAASPDESEAVQTDAETNVEMDKLTLAETAPVISIAQLASDTAAAENDILPVEKDTAEQAESQESHIYAEQPVRTRATVPVFYPAPAAEFDRPAFHMLDRYLVDRIAETNEFLKERRAQREQRIAENRAHMDEFMEAMDREYLQNVREFQVRSLEYRREQIAREQQRLEEMEQRFLDTYRTRAAYIQRRQEERFQIFPDRI